MLDDLRLGRGNSAAARHHERQLFVAVQVVLERLRLLSSDSEALPIDVTDLIVIADFPFFSLVCSENGIRRPLRINSKASLN